MKALSIAPILALALAGPACAQAETAVPPGIDRALWCASAFYWLAGSAEDSGDAEEAELYDGWSKRLLEMSSEALTGIGTPADEIERLIADYDHRTLEQLGTDTAAYDIVSCPDLLGENQQPETESP